MDRAKENRPTLAEDEELEDWVGPDLPGLGAVLVGLVLFMLGGMLMLTVIGIPFGLLLFAAGLGLMLTPKERKT